MLLLPGARSCRSVLYPTWEAPNINGRLELEAASPSMKSNALLLCRARAKLHREQCAGS
jgi:hypothetical protein